MKTLRASLFITLAISFGCWLGAQTPSLPGIQGFYYAGKAYKAVAVDANGKLQITASFTPSGTQDVNLKQVSGSTVATAATGIQKVGLADGTGNAITSTASALDVNIKSGGTSLAATVSGSVAVGGAAPNPITDGTRDSSNNVLANHSCDLQATVTISAGTDAVIVTGVSAKNIYICHLDFASDTTAGFTVRQGTGSTCGTNTATLAGAYPNTITAAFDFGNWSPLRTTVAARDVCLHASTSATVGGVVIYGQY